MDSENRIEESFEVLDITGTARERNIAKQIMDQITVYVDKYPVASRAFIGGTGGYVTGFVFKKVGRTAASAVGGGMVLMQIAHRMGYITINTGRMNRDARRFEERVRREMSQNETMISNFLHRAEEFVQKNSPAALGFTAGFLLGLAT